MSAVDPLQSSLFFSASAQASQAVQAKRREEEKKSAASGVKRFSDVLNEEKKSLTAEELGLPPEIAKLGYDQAVQVLLDSVYSSGDALKKNFNAETVVEYKKSVKNFLRFAVKNSYEIDVHESARSIKKRKKFCQLQIIDQKLDNLAAGVLFNNRDQFNLLAKIDEINGLLVDLVS